MSLDDMVFGGGYAPEAEPPADFSDPRSTADQLVARMAQTAVVPQPGIGVDPRLTMDRLHRKAYEDYVLNPNPFPNAKTTHKPGKGGETDFSDFGAPQPGGEEQPQDFSEFGEQTPLPPPRPPEANTETQQPLEPPAEQGPGYLEKAAQAVEPKEGETLRKPFTGLPREALALGIRGVDKTIDWGKRVYDEFQTAKPADKAKPPTPDTPNQISQGVQSGVVGQTPKLSGAALEGFGWVLKSIEDAAREHGLGALLTSSVTGGEYGAKTLIDYGKKIQGFGDEQQKALQPRVASYRNIRTDSIGDFLEDSASFAGFQLGQGVVSTAPGLLMNVAARRLGFGKLGQWAATMAPSFIQNYGDVYSDSKDDKDIQELIKSGKLSEEKLALYAMGAGTVMAALDVYGVEQILKEPAHGWPVSLKDLGKRIVKGYIRGTVAEGSTEGLQQVVSEWFQANMGSNKPAYEQFVSILDNALGGAITGGTMAGGRAAFPSSGTPTTPPFSPPSASPGPPGLGGPPPGAGPTPAGPGAPPPPPAPAAGLAPPNFAARAAASSPEEQLDILRQRGYSDEDIAGMSPEQFQGEVEQGLTEGTGARPGTRAAPLQPEDLAGAESVTNPTPTPAQREAGNYQHTHAELPELGLTGRNGISIETDMGGTRQGPIQQPDAQRTAALQSALETAEVSRKAQVNASQDTTALDKEIAGYKDELKGAPAWTAPNMPAAYGRSKQIMGADSTPTKKQGLDFFIGSARPGGNVYVIDQIDPKTGKFDEHKVMARFHSPVEAVLTYLKSYSDDAAARIGGLTMLTPDQFKEWTKDGHVTGPLSETMKAKEKGGAGETRVGSGAPPSPAKDTERATTAPEGARAGEATQQQASNAATVGSVPTSDAAMKGIASLFGENEATAPSAQQPDTGVTESSENKDTTLTAESQIEDALRETGVDPATIAPVVIHRAAEFMGSPGWDPVTAFGAAVVSLAYESDHAIYQELVNAYGQANVQAVLHAASALEHGVRGEEGGAATGGAPAEVHGRGVPGGGEAGVQQGGEATPAAEGDQAAEAAAEPAERPATRAGAEQPAGEPVQEPVPGEHEQAAGAAESLIDPKVEEAIRNFMRTGREVGAFEEAKAGEPEIPISFLRDFAGMLDSSAADESTEDPAKVRDNARRLRAEADRREAVEGKKPVDARAQMEAYARSIQLPIDSIMPKDLQLAFEFMEKGRDAGGALARAIITNGLIDGTIKADELQLNKEDKDDLIREADARRGGQAAAEGGEPAPAQGAVVPEAGERAPGAGEGTGQGTEQPAVGGPESGAQPEHEGKGQQPAGPVSQPTSTGEQPAAAGDQPAPAAGNQSEPGAAEQPAETAGSGQQPAAGLHGVRDERPEHPGLIIHSLETGKETTIQPIGTRQPAKADTLADAFAASFDRNGAFKTILAARKFAKEAGFSEDPKVVEEAIEAAVVRSARAIVARDNTPLTKFSLLRDLYSRQPNLGTRTSTSVRDQAYSTPIPLAYAASVLAGVTNDTTVYEPTAGNGALLVAANPEKARANEINPARRKNLEAQGFEVTGADASERMPSTKKFDVVLANPPFGVVRENGASKNFDMSGIQPGYRTNEIDHAIALIALESMKDDGKAVLIIGGISKQLTENEKRSDAYNGRAKREFFKALYDRYKVVDHFTVAGELYAKQGAAWPVDVIVIHGRGKSARSLPAVDVPRVLKTWEDVGKVLPDANARGSAEPVRSGAGEAAEGAPSGGPAEQHGGVSQPTGRSGTRSGTAAGERSAGVRGQPVQQPRAEPAPGERTVAPGVSEPGRAGAEAAPGGRPSGLTAEDFGKVFDEYVGETPTAFELPRDFQFLAPGEPDPSNLPLTEKGLASWRVYNPGGFPVGTGATKEEAYAAYKVWDAKETGSDEPASKPRNPRNPRTTTEVAKATVTAAVDSADAALAGLSALFGGPKTSMGLSFDPETYAKAKPLFAKAAEQFGQFKDNLVELMRRMLAELETVYGMTKDQLAKMRPYVIQFMQDVQSGAVNLTFPETKATEKPAPKQGMKKDIETENQVSYTASSEGPGLGTLLPVNLKRATDEALAKLQEKVGNLDEFVRDELGYSSKDEMWEGLGAEQVDGIAMMIDGMKRNLVAGSIIGDQTGIGKGRQVAAMIRWAIRNNRVPVFFTAGPKLYVEMYDDMKQIGMGKMLGRNPRILVTNTDLKLPLDREDPSAKISTGDAKDHGRILIENGDFGTLKKNYDMVFSTYSQIQTVKGGETQRRNFMRRLAPDALFIFDESHKAGGQGAAQGRGPKNAPAGRAKLVRQLIQAANNRVVYSSATYAKRADVMDLYAATDMRFAVDNIEELGAAIASGGVPMQQVVAAMLVEAGQYIRRERSFAGVNYDAKTVNVDRDMYDQISGGLASINNFSSFVKRVVKDIRKDMKSQGGTTRLDNAVGVEGAESTNFTSKLHNVINQILLSMKSAPAVEEAVAALKRGEKPVIAVANTMESFLQKYSEDAGLQVGKPMTATFNDVLDRYLERSREIRIKKAFGESAEAYYLTDADLDKVPGARQAWANAKEAIRNLPLDDLPVSPIDFMRDGLTKAGYKVSEITGRGLTVDYSGDEPLLARRNAKELSIRGKEATRVGFQDGDIDVIILNQSGAEGLSLHASERAKDQRRRLMIIAQAEGNIDTHMQILGRIHRTGQIVTPNYIQLAAGIPAELRPTSILMKKMASLNANTTAARESAVTAKDVPDLMNEYGDEVAIQYIMDNPGMNERLGNPITFVGDEPEEDGAMRRLTGRLPMLRLNDQEAAWVYFMREYTQLLAAKEAAGENALEAKVMPLKAITRERTEVRPRTNDSGSPFAAPVIMEKVRAVRLGKPYTSAEIAERVAKSLNTPVPTTNAKELIRWLEKLESGPSYYNKEIGEVIKAAMQPVQDDAISRFETYKREVLDEIEKPEREEAERVRLDGVQNKWVHLYERLKPGARFTLKTSNGNLIAIALGVKQEGKPTNPLALSTWKADFAIADSGRHVIIPFSRLSFESTDNMRVTELGYRHGESYENTLSWFEVQQREAHEDRYIATGNMLAAYDWLERKGKITHFTDDQGHIRQGILTARNFELGEHARKHGRPLNASELQDWMVKHPGAPLTDKNNLVTVEGGYNGDLYVNVKANKKLAGFIYLDQKLIEAAGNDLEQRGRYFRVIVPRARIPGVIERLAELHSTFSIPLTDLKTEKVVSTTASPDGEEKAMGKVYTLNPANESARRQIQREIQQIVDQALGPVVHVQFPNEIRTTPSMQDAWGGTAPEVVPGAFLSANDLIKVVIGTGIERETAYHEIFHGYMKYYATKAEKALLKAETTRLRHKLAEIYNLTADEANRVDPEEVQSSVAAAYQIWRDTNNPAANSGIHIGVRAMLEKLWKMFQRIKNFLLFRGYNSFEDIVTKLYGGTFQRDRFQGPQRAASPAVPLYRPYVPPAGATTAPEANDIANDNTQSRPGWQTNMSRTYFSDPDTAFQAMVEKAPVLTERQKRKLRQEENEIIERPNKDNRSFFTKEERQRLDEISDRIRASDARKAGREQPYVYHYEDPAHRNLFGHVMPEWQWDESKDYGRTEYTARLFERGGGYQRKRGESVTFGTLEGAQRWVETKIKTGQDIEDQIRKDEEPQLRREAVTQARENIHIATREEGLASLPKSTPERWVLKMFDGLEKGPRNQSFFLPEGEMYVRQGYDEGLGGRTFEIARIDFKEGLRGRGAFTNYLGLIEKEAGARSESEGYQAVVVEQVHNKRLAEFLVRRGYKNTVELIDINNQLPPHIRDLLFKNAQPTFFLRVGENPQEPEEKGPPSPPIPIRPRDPTESAQADWDQGEKTWIGNSPPPGTIPGWVDNMTFYFRPTALMTRHEKQLSKAVLEISKQVSPGVTVGSVDRIVPPQGAIPSGTTMSAVYLGPWWSDKTGVDTLIAVTLSTHPIQSYLHEVIHHLRSGFFYPHEWIALEDAAHQGNWIKQYQIDERYSHKGYEHQLEEAIAERYADWAYNNVLNGVETPAAAVRAFRKIKSFFDRLRRKVYEIFGRSVTVDDLFTKVSTGEVGSRERTDFGYDRFDSRPGPITDTAEAPDLGERAAGLAGSGGAPPYPKRPFSIGRSFSEMRQALLSTWASAFQPEVLSDNALQADPLFARYRAARGQERDSILKQSQSWWDYWNVRSDQERLAFLHEVETGQPPNAPDKHAMWLRFRAMLNRAYMEEQRWGSKAAYWEEYFPHVWTDVGAATAWVKEQVRQLGPTWFQKHRFYDTIQAGLGAGLRLSSSNPVDLLTHRLLSGADMRMRMQLLYDLKRMGLAWEASQGGQPLRQRGWIPVNAPDRQQWMVAPDMQYLWQNAVEAKGLWQLDNGWGKGFRGWMMLKNAYVPIKLMLSLFHPLHVLHINQAQYLGQGLRELGTGNIRAGAGSIVHGLATLPTAGLFDYFQGRRAKHAWEKRKTQMTPPEAAMVKIMEDGGFTPQLSEEQRIAARRALAVAWQRATSEPWFAVKLPFIAARRLIEKLQAPIFEHWIPAVKAAAYLNEAASFFMRNPHILNDDIQYRQALRTIGKSIDNRFGEMFYGAVFQNRVFKDAMIGSFLSYGWNFGFAREFIGGALEVPGRIAGKVMGETQTKRTQRAASNKIPFVIAYASSAMMIAGLMTWGLSGAPPDQWLDYIFPRQKQKNADGSSRRLTTMFYTREIPMLKKHIEEHGGNVLAGTAAMVNNKLLIKPIIELYTNRDYYGYEIRNSNDPAWKQLWQHAQYLFEDATNPISVLGAKRAADLSGQPFPRGKSVFDLADKETAQKFLDAMGAPGVLLALAGFGPAPAYAEKSAIQNRIGHLYGEFVAPNLKPQERRETAEEVRGLRTAILDARANGDQDKLQEYYKRGRELGLSMSFMTNLGKIPTDVYLFSRLPDEQQISLIRQMTPGEKTRYWPSAHQKVKQLFNKEAEAVPAQ